MASFNAQTSQQFLCADSTRRPRRYHTSCHCDFCHEVATREVIQIAILLNRNLPADVIPAILDYAGMRRRIELPEMSNNPWSEKIKNHFFDDAYIIPRQILPGSIREIKFWIKTWSVNDLRSSNQNTSVPDKEHTWAEATIRYLGGKKDYERRSRISTPLETAPTVELLPTPNATAQQPLSDYESIRLVTYTNKDCWDTKESDLDVKESNVFWTVESKDRNVRTIMKELCGGSAIELRGFTKPLESSLYASSHSIEIEYAMVTKM